MNKQIDPMETEIALDDDLMDEAADNDALDANLPVAAATAAKKLITTIALTMDTCRWPFGDPVEADFHYCGELPLVGRPYCSKHDAQSYHASRPKKAAA
jgi:GcrA cell cycle regulator